MKTDTETKEMKNKVKIGEVEFTMPFKAEGLKIKIECFTETTSACLFLSLLPLKNRLHTRFAVNYTTKLNRRFTELFSRFFDISNQFD